jgi:hypothetical protein
LETIEDPRPLLEAAIGVLMLVLVIIVHGVCLRVINRRFSRSWSRVTTQTSRWRVDLLLALVVLALATLHMVETLIFAIPLRAAGMFPALRDSYFFVIESYTTLGAGSLSLPEQWRLLGPIIAMAGLFTFGWTGSVLVAVMAQFGHFDRAQAEEEMPADAARGPRRTPEP